MRYFHSDSGMWPVTLHKYLPEVQCRRCRPFYPFCHACLADPVDLQWGLDGECFFLYSMGHNDLQVKIRSENACIIMRGILKINQLDYIFSRCGLGFQPDINQSAFWSHALPHATQAHKLPARHANPAKPDCVYGCISTSAAVIQKISLSHWLTVCIYYRVWLTRRERRCRTVLKSPPEIELNLKQLKCTRQQAKRAHASRVKLV